jgi:hypothetical protein
MTILICISSVGKSLTLYLVHVSLKQTLLMSVFLFISVLDTLLKVVLLPFPSQAPSCPPPPLYLQILNKIPTSLHLQFLIQYHTVTPYTKPLIAIPCSYLSLKVPLLHTYVYVYS